ncbi:hypothetical protein PQG02_03960 [Nostoc sp. UHCC 0926]|uniref:hypothetical protein n=1 Tax=unclassified Nostoc TaxID=2593658 RepID=UPI00235FF4BF|nr:hypothetical protein [Nostoc sp. UHCC 0926]WDD33551.1 hypothetical protein PQG02_03960 [Nostoc sp. UHCC 0926]
MISGIVKNGRATVNIIFRLPNQPDFTIEFFIDTGFTEFLSLPTVAVTLLGFPFVYDMYANLAVIVAKWTIDEYHRMINAGILSDRTI